MKLYQLIANVSPTKAIQELDYVYLVDTLVFPTTKKVFLTLQCYYNKEKRITIEGTIENCLVEINLTPDTDHYIVDRMSATEKSEYFREDPCDQKFFDDNFTCIVDYNHPYYIAIATGDTDKFDSDMDLFWNKGERPRYVIKKL